jgi:hypothetical protein
VLLGAALASGNDRHDDNWTWKVVEFMVLSVTVWQTQKFVSDRDARRVFFLVGTLLGVKLARSCLKREVPEC